QLIIKASLDTLAGIDGAPAGQLEWGGRLPVERVRRLPADPALPRSPEWGGSEQGTTLLGGSIPPASRGPMFVRDHTGDSRVVAAKQRAVLKPAANLAHQLLGVVAR